MSILGSVFLSSFLPEQSILDHGCQETCLCETFVRAPRTLAISTAEACNGIQTVEGLCCWQCQVSVLIARAFADDVMSPALRFNNEAYSLKVRLSQQEKGGRENQLLTGKGRGYLWECQYENCGVDRPVFPWLPTLPMRAANPGEKDLVCTQSNKTQQSRHGSILTCFSTRLFVGWLLPLRGLFKAMSGRIDTNSSFFLAAFLFIATPISNTPCPCQKLTDQLRRPGLHPCSSLRPTANLHLTG